MNRPFVGKVSGPVYVIMLLNVFQVCGWRLGVSCTWKMSFVGAYQLRRNPFVPPMVVLMILTIRMTFVDSGVAGQEQTLLRDCKRPPRLPALLSKPM